MKTIKAKISVLLTAISTMIIVVFMVAATIINSKNVTALCESYLYDTCVSASNTLYESFYGDNERQNLDVRLQYILYNVGIQTMDSSQAYLVDADGTYLYHPDRAMVGTPMSDNQVVLGVLNTLNTEGYMPPASVALTTVAGEEVYVAYMVTVNDWIIYVQADKSDVNAPVVEIAVTTLILGLILLIVAIAIGLYMTKRIDEPIKGLTHIINSISELDLTDDTQFKYADDEIGTMVQAVMNMKEKLSQIVTELNDISGTLLADSNTLYEISEDVTSASTDNSATNQELAASMDTTSSVTENVTENVMGMNANAMNVADKISEGTNLTTEIRGKAYEIKEKTSKAREETIEVYNSIKHTADEAIIKAKEVDKINALAAAIQDIADQTTLLSLNASIEAARAGEQGKGFAVVAGEISSLASESNKTGDDIVIIVNQVNSSVETLIKCLVEALDFLENKVMSDYDEFMTSSDQYSEGASSVEDFMTIANNEINSLRDSISAVTEAMEGINKNIGECSIGINDIAQKTTNVVDLSSESFERTTNCKNNAEKLSEITSRFKF